MEAGSQADVAAAEAIVRSELGKSLAVVDVGLPRVAALLSIQPRFNSLPITAGDRRAREFSEYFKARAFLLLVYPVRARL